MASVQAEPAIVGMDQGCFLLDGDGNIVPADTDQSVITNNGKGTGKLTCHAEGVVNTTGKAVHWDFDSTGIFCGTPSVPTDNWKATISQNDDGTTGDAVLTCRTK
jgi:hypothetical protein